MDLNAFSVAGNELAGWPKLTTDWMVTNPTIGSFGTLDTAAGSRKTVISETRSGYIHAYSTSAPACSPSTWPRFHHDDANSGDYARDAKLPGKPFGLAATATRITFRAPGDDLLCGTAHHYQIVTSASPITAANFRSAQTLPGAPTPGGAGAAQSYTLPAAAKRYVAIRAVDEAGNVGLPAAVDRG
jgi:hypothetical protein